MPITLIAGLATAYCGHVEAIVLGQNASMEQQRVAVVLTALPVEYATAREHLVDLREEVHGGATVYERGTFTASDGRGWSVALVEVGPGNEAAAAEAERDIAYFKPSIAAFMGVAGGLEDVRLCDVVAATKVYGYESGKDRGYFETRPAMRLASYRLEQRARAEARSGR